MNFINLTPDIEDEWDSLVYQSDDGWAFSLSGWLKMVTPVWKLENCSFAIAENGRIVALMPLHLYPKAGWLSSSGWGHGGPIIDADASQKDRRRLFRKAWNHTIEIALQTGATRITASVSPLSQSSLKSRWGVNPLVECGAEDTSTHTYIIDLLQAESGLWTGLSQDARQQIKKARLAGYSVKRRAWKEMLEEYYRVHVETYRRTGVNPHPKSYFEGVAESVGHNHSVLWVGLDKNGRAVAFHNDARFRDTAMYHTGCSETAHLESGINYLLFWEAVLGAKEDKCSWYESGEAFPQARAGKEKGLTVFKRKFGGELHRVFRGVVELPKLQLHPMPIKVSSTPASLSDPAVTILDTVAHPDAHLRALFRNWLRATRDLLAPMLGQRLTQMLQSALVRLVAVEGALHLRVMSIKRVIIERAGVLNNKYINPPIDFIKPYWSEVETNIGFSETTISRKEATERFTERFRKSFGLAEDVLILPTGSGRTALELALKTLKKKFPTRTKVMIPTYGCKGTFDPIVRSGLIPVLVDIDRDLLMDFQKTKELLTTDTLACIPVHLCGKQMDTRPFFEQARKHGIVIIEDHCQFNGGEIYYPYGDFMPDLTIYSFGPWKNIIATAGGALVSRILKDELRTESKQLREEEIGLAHHRFAYYYRSYFRREQAPTTDQTDIMAARTNPYEYAAMNSLDALILFEQLSKLNAIIDARRRNAYAVISQLQLFPHLYSIQSAGPHIYTKLSVILPNRDLLESFRTFLSKKRIELENMYIPLHLRDLGVPFEAGDLSASEDLYPLVVNIPVRPNLTKREVSRIKRAVKGFGKNNSVNLSSEELEKGNLDKYNSKFYHADSITVTPPADPTSYSDVLLQERLYLASEYAENAVALDLCCGTGEHLFYLAKNISEGIGFDYSKPFIEKANRTRALLGLTKVEFIQGNARRLPFGDGHFDLVYCFSSLQHIPNVGEVINEISRVLRPGGKCVLDMGNIYSLNTIVCNAYPEYAHPFHVSVACMKKMIYGSDFRILRHKAFQILPMWGDRPKWLKPLLLRGLTRLLGKRIRGKMLDEWISNLPVLKLFAFRHVFVCEKNGSRLTK